MIIIVIIIINPPWAQRPLKSDSEASLIILLHLVPSCAE